MAGCRANFPHLTCVLLSLAGVWTVAVPSSSDAFAQDRTTVRLIDEPALKAIVSVEATNLPLSEALASIAKQAKVDMSAEAPVGRQRVTLHLTGQELSHVMARIPGLLSHAPETPTGYYWEKLERPAGRRTAYRLWRNSRSKRDEEEELDYPRKKCALMFREFRDMIRMSPEQRKAYKGEFSANPPGDAVMAPFRDAVAGMTDADVDTLIETGSVPVAPGRCLAETAQFNQQWHLNAVQSHEVAHANGTRDPYPFGVPETPPTAPKIRFSVYDSAGQKPEHGAEYGLSLDGMHTGWGPPSATGGMTLGFNPYHYPMEASLDIAADEHRPVFDLAPLLADAKVTSEQRGDLGFTLQALAKTARINLYQEAFYKGGYSGARSQGIRLLKGTLPQLLDAICREWSYRVKKVNDDYFLWSRTWARDRAFDIPETVLAGWRARDAKQGGFTLNDKFDIVSPLTWPQIRLTLNLAIESSGPWNSGSHDADIYRFCGRFNPAERRQLVHGGLTLEAMEPPQRQALIQEVIKSKPILEPADLNGAYLALTYDKIYNKSKVPSQGHPVERRAWLEVKSPVGLDTGSSPRILWQTALYYTAPVPAP